MVFHNIEGQDLRPIRSRCFGLTLGELEGDLALQVFTNEFSNAEALGDSTLATKEIGLLWQ